LVTGAAGFIGAATALRLVARGDEVMGLDNVNYYYAVPLKESWLKQLLPHANFRFVRMDVANRIATADLFLTKRFDRVVRLAAQAFQYRRQQQPSVFA
jgi:UDP-glucuronate 4-epimerase